MTSFEKKGGSIDKKELDDTITFNFDKILLLLSTVFPPIILTMERRKLQRAFKSIFQLTHRLIQPVLVVQKKKKTKNEKFYWTAHLRNSRGTG